jgi:hypothetical protein
MVEYQQPQLEIEVEVHGCRGACGPGTRSRYRA